MRNTRLEKALNELLLVADTSLNPGPALKAIYDLTAEIRNAAKVERQEARHEGGLRVMGRAVDLLASHREVIDGLKALEKIDPEKAREWWPDSDLSEEEANGVADGWNFCVDAVKQKGVRRAGAVVSS